MNRAVRLFLMGLAGFYLLNWSLFGTYGLEVISDNIPIFGNLDEAAAGIIIGYLVRKR